MAEYESSDEVANQEIHAEKRIIYLLKNSPDLCFVKRDIRTIREADPNASIAILAEKLEPDQLVDVFTSGGDGLLLEDISAEALNRSLMLIEIGEKVFPSKLAAMLSGDKAIPRPLRSQTNVSSLSRREIEIVRSLTAGLSNKEIANSLNLAVATVKVHVKSLLKKLGLKNRTQAAIWGLYAGISETGEMTIGDGTSPSAGAALCAEDEHGSPYARPEGDKDGPRRHPAPGAFHLRISAAV